MSQSVANKSVSSNKSLSKRFTNGHVCFVAAQQKAFQELLKKEFEKKERFDRLKTELKMPRNPLIGEPTPREGEGRPLINEYWLEMESPAKARPKDVTAKIGIDDTKYQFLGNSPTRQKSRPQLVSAGLAALGSPSAQLANQRAFDLGDVEPESQPAGGRPDATGAPAASRMSSRPSISRHVSNIEHASGQNGSGVSAAGSRQGNGSRHVDDWESQGTDFYFRILK